MYDSERVLMTKIAILFYEDGYTQEEIGKMFNMSRLQVHRRLKAAVDSKVVQIRVESEYRNLAILEKTLKKIFNIEDIVVVRSSGDFENNMDNLAQGGAQLLMNKVKAGDHIGVSWGSTVSKIPDYLSDKKLTDISVGNIVGGLTFLGDKGAQEVAIKIAMALNGTPRLLNLPFKLESSETRNLILQDESIENHIKALKLCDICVVGIGYVGQNLSEDIISQYKKSVQAEIRKVIKDKKAVGEIIGRYFDINGNQIIIEELENTVIGLNLEDLRNLPITIGVAGGVEKAHAIIGALRGKYINCLVTDELTAQAMIDIVKGLRCQ